MPSLRSLSKNLSQTAKTNQYRIAAHAVGSAVMKRAKTLCVAAILAVLTATLWPFNPIPRNQVAWISGGQGLRFQRPGLVLSKGYLSASSFAGESYSLELFIRPASVRSAYTILGLYVPGRRRQFLVRQFKDGLLITHDASVERDPTRTKKFDVDHVFQRGSLVLVTISFGPTGTTVYVNGRSEGSFPKFRILRNELAGQVVIGTSPVIDQPWAGELHGLAIYSKELAAAEALQHYNQWSDAGRNPISLDSAMNNAIVRYAFREGAGREVREETSNGPALEIPSTFFVPHKPFLQSPAAEFKPDRNYAIDVVLNVAGFIPLGLVLCAYLSWNERPWNTILITSFFCGALSLAIEMAQYYIPRRGSGITDIVTNTLGAAIGALLVKSESLRSILQRTGMIPQSAEQENTESMA